ncbi:Crp/Fnr family transcriptional regulator [Iodobacter ciconiae]|uniref:Crp/Fnr family transcriptional regulator n=2 Tax=Iodobacter ciconiae TaxID=2496266 RepID=A0A3S8ZWS9_9NEIS|nr:Crp/Fnr family transcriptional regulator [Iodobacter ciconiae]
MLMTRHPIYSLEFFSGISENILTSIASDSQLRTAVRNQQVITKGSLGDELFFLIKGRLQVTDVTEDGRELCIYIINEGEYFGELAVIDGGSRSTSVVSIGDAELMTMSRHTALQLIYSHPILAERLMKKLAYLVRLSSQNRAMLSIQNPYQRICTVLTTLIRTLPGNLKIIELPPQQSLAGMTNCSRETVSRAIGQLLNTGIAEKDRKTLIVREPERLQHIVQGKIATE